MSSVPKAMTCNARAKAVAPAKNPMTVPRHRNKEKSAKHWRESKVCWMGAYDTSREVVIANDDELGSDEANGR